ncbi:hypothetical protein [Brachybacterium tyrofermentans]|uniref:hypothetical protein n=1 Tax=Brachybacterium tyrofermentans TaxID=47848 RepID=UPI003F913657
MTSIMRRTVRGAAAGLGALAIVAGAAACGGSDSTEEKPAAEQEQPAEDEKPAEEEKPADEEKPAADEESAAEEGEEAAEDAAKEGEDVAGEEGDADAAESGDAAPLEEADLTAAGDRFLEFIQVMDDGDGEAACAYFLDPTTGEPVSGEVLTACGEQLAPSMEGLEPGSMDMLERSMIETTDNGDGTAAVNMAGTDFPYTMMKDSSGEWYLSLT